MILLSTYFVENFIAFISEMPNKVEVTVEKGSSRNELACSG